MQIQKIITFREKSIEIDILYMFDEFFVVARYLIIWYFSLRENRYLRNVGFRKLAII